MQACTLRGTGSSPHLSFPDVSTRAVSQQLPLPACSLHIGRPQTSCLAAQPSLPATTSSVSGWSCLRQVHPEQVPHNPAPPLTCKQSLCCATTRRMCCTFREVARHVWQMVNASRLTPKLVGTWVLLISLARVCTCPWIHPLAHICMEAHPSPCLAKPASLACTTIALPVHVQLLTWRLPWDQTLSSSEVGEGGRRGHATPGEHACLPIETARAVRFLG